MASESTDESTAAYLFSFLPFFYDTSPPPWHLPSPDSTPSPAYLDPWDNSWDEVCHVLSAEENHHIPVKIMKFQKYMQARIGDVSKPLWDRELIKGTDSSFKREMICHDWYRDASPSQKRQLRNFLMQLDRQNRVDPQNDQTKFIHKGVQQIMTDLSEKMALLQPRLAGKLFGVGSSHNGTKVGEPDEFDFIFELNARTLLDDKGASTSAEMQDNFLKTQVRIADLSDKKHLIEFLELYDSKSIEKFPIGPCYKKLVEKIWENTNELTFNSEHIAFAFFMFLNEALQQLDLPKGWSHGGFDRPRFSGVRLRHPSFFIQLYYDGTETCTSTHGPLSVSVDFVPVLKVDHPFEETSRQTGVLEDYLHSIGGADWVHLPYNPTELPLTWYEERLLSEYHFESVAKTVIRVFKVLCKEACCSIPHYVSNDSSERRYLSKQNPKYADNRIRDPSDWSLEGMKDVANRKDGSIFTRSEWYRRRKQTYFDDTLVTGEDIGENLGNYDIVSSYEIKLTVMTLIALDPNKGKSWTSDDMVDIVLSICLVYECLFGENVSREKLNMSVSLDRYYQTRDNTEAESTARTFQSPPKLLNEFSEALRCGNCSKLMSRLSKKTKRDRIDAILEILRSACYGKSTAKFEVGCFYLDDTPNRYVQKADLKPFV